MAKIISLGEYQDKYTQKEFEKKLQEEIEKVETKLGLEDEPLLVLTDMDAITIGDYLLDARNEIKNVLEEINNVLSILNIDECEELPDGLQLSNK